MGRELIMIGRRRYLTAFVLVFETCVQSVPPLVVANIPTVVPAKTDEPFAAIALMTLAVMPFCILVHVTPISVETYAPPLVAAPTSRSPAFAGVHVMPLSLET